MIFSFGGGGGARSNKTSPGQNHQSPKIIQRTTRQSAGEDLIQLKKSALTINPKPYLSPRAFQIQLVIRVFALMLQIYALVSEIIVAVDFFQNGKVITFYTKYRTTFNRSLNWINVVNVFSCVWSFARLIFRIWDVTMFYRLGYFPETDYPMVTKFLRVQFLVLHDFSVSIVYGILIVDGFLISVSILVSFAIKVVNAIFMLISNMFILYSDYGRTRNWLNIPYAVLGVFLTGLTIVGIVFVWDSGAMSALRNGFQCSSFVMDFNPSIPLAAGSGNATFGATQNTVTPVQVLGNTTLVERSSFNLTTKTFINYQIGCNATLVIPFPDIYYNRYLNYARNDGVKNSSAWLAMTLSFNNSDTADVGTQDLYLNVNFNAPYRLTFNSSVFWSNSSFSCPLSKGNVFGSYFQRFDCSTSVIKQLKNSRVNLGDFVAYFITMAVNVGYCGYRVSEYQNIPPDSCFIAK